MFNVGFWGDPKFSDAAEQKYTVLLLEHEERAVARSYLFLASFAWIPLVVMRLTHSIGFYESSILTTFHVLKALVCIALLMSKPSTNVLRRAVFFMLLTAQVVWTAGALVGAIGGSGPKWLATYWILLILAGNMFLPVRSYGHNLIFILSLFTTHFALRNYPNYGISYLMIVVCLTFGQNYRLYTHRMIKLSAMLSFREQSRYIPRQVLVASAETQKSIFEIFSPANRFCICICSDWRNFQNLASSIPMVQLGQGLADYYQDIVDMLHRRFPDGEFFIDWIADELFVVIFAKGEARDERLLKKAFSAATEILHYRKAYHSKAGFPDGIDIGISCGLASVGIFGGDGVAKATAFGMTPGIARALQSAGRELRQSIGARDRIVMQPEVVSEMPEVAKDCDLLDAATLDSEDSLATNGVRRIAVWDGRSESLARSA
ncbi:MAG: hypothetical protein RIQ81_2240 [Pseudomonadota bacterium]